MPELELRLTPGLSGAAFAAEFHRSGVVQIPGLFEPDVAAGLAQVLERQTPWCLVHSNTQGTQDSLDEATLARLGPAEVQTRVDGVMRRAATGFGYIYLGYDMIDAYLEGRDPGHPLHLLSELLNTEPFLELGRQVIGGPRPTKTEAYATLYRPGDFLNLHDDFYKGQRRAAFTIGLTRRWRPDWGGQLMFHDARGEVTRVLAPGFNVLTVFKTPRPHSVATVAPYAAGPRLSIAGWLRGDPVGT